MLPRWDLLDAIQFHYWKQHGFNYLWKVCKGSLPIRSNFQNHFKSYYRMNFWRSQTGYKFCVKLVQFMQNHNKMFLNEDTVIDSSDFFSHSNFTAWKSRSDSKILPKHDKMCPAESHWMKDKVESTSNVSLDRERLDKVGVGVEVDHQAGVHARPGRWLLVIHVPVGQCRVLAGTPKEPVLFTVYNSCAMDCIGLYNWLY